ncbi:CsgE family curli-type amyloid fiber assembly protein [Lacinutrix chionoecetis]
MRLKFIKHIVFTICALVFLNTNAQNVIYNKEVKAQIKIDRTSEFTTFAATSENLTYSGRNLRYEFMMFKADTSGNVAKSAQSNKFFLQNYEKKILSSVTINNQIDGKVTLLLLVYPNEEEQDETQGAIGKCRLVITSNENGQLNIEGDLEKEIFLQGLVIKKVLTKSGRDFHRYFYSEYFNKQVTTEKHIVIKEVPGQRRSTRITVEVDGQLVWQFFARPKKEFLQKMADISLDRSIRYLQQLQQRQDTQIRY